MLQGEFFSIAHPVEAPFSAPPLPAIASYDKMMYLWLTDYIANTAGVVYQQAGILQVTVTPDMVCVDPFLHKFQIIHASMNPSPSIHLFIH